MTAKLFPMIDHLTIKPFLMINHLTAKLIQMSNHLTAKTMSIDELSQTGSGYCVIVEFGPLFQDS